MPREERHKNSCEPIAHGEIGIGPALYRGDLDHAGQTRGGAGEETRNENEPSDRETDNLGGTDVAAGNPCRKSKYRVIDQDIGQNRCHDAKNQAPVDVGARDAADHIGGTDCGCGWLVEACRIPHGALDKMIEDRERDRDEQQARNRLIHTAVMAQAPGERDPKPATRHSGKRHCDLNEHRWRRRHHQRRSGRRERANQERTLSADDHHAELRGKSRAQRREDQRRRARQCILPREPAAKRALVHVEIEVQGILAE